MKHLGGQILPTLGTGPRVRRLPLASARQPPAGRHLQTGSTKGVNRRRAQ